MVWLDKHIKRFFIINGYIIYYSFLNLSPLAIYLMIRTLMNDKASKKVKGMLCLLVKLEWHYVSSSLQLEVVTTRKLLTRGGIYAQFT